MSDGTIASLKILLGLDSTGVTKGIGTAKSQVSGFGISAGTAFKAVGAAASLGFGIATKGALSMNKVQGEFQAATGKSRAQAVAFSKDMNALMGTTGAVGHSFEEVAALGTTVEQQFGTTGKATADLTENILEFAKVTGGDADTAAGQLRDTLTAYGMSADDASGFMDQLVASNQKFGTKIGPETLDILQHMAPALQDMGMGLDDGVGLLNAFQVAGLDAGTAQKGLNAALQHLPPGQTFDDLIKKIGDMKSQGLDPTTEAIKLFGIKAGPALAQAIQPGMTSLDQFKIKAQDADGAVTTAADNMETLPERFEKVFDKVGATLRGFGQDFGPLLSASGSIVSAFAALPDAIQGPLENGLKGVWSKIATSGPVKLAAGLAGAAASGAYSVAAAGADALAGLLKEAWAGLKVSTQLVIAGAGAVAGGIYDAAAAGVDLMTDALEGLWKDVAARAPIIKAIFGAGGQHGLIYTTAAFVIEKFTGAAGAVWDAMGNPGSVLMQKVVLAGSLAGASYAGGFIFALGTAGLGLIAKGGTDFLSNLDFFKGQSPTQIANRLAAGNFGKGMTAAGQQAGETLATTASATLEVLGPPIPPGYGVTWGAGIVTSAIPALKAAAQLLGITFADAFEHDSRVPLANAGEAAGVYIGQGLSSNPDAMVPGAKSIVESFRTWWNSDGKPKLTAAGSEGAIAFSEGVLAERGTAQDAWQQFVDMMKHPIDTAKEIAELQGHLTSKKMIKGLSSNDPQTRQWAEDTRDAIQSRIDDLQKLLGDDGTSASDKLQSGLSSNYPAIKSDASDFVGRMNTIFGGLDTKYVIDVNTSRIAKNAPHFASGGRYQAGTLAVVGDAGRPELFISDQSGYIAPDARSALAGGDSYTFNIYDATDPHKVAVVVLDTMKRVATIGGSLSLDRSGVPG